MAGTGKGRPVAAVTGASAGIGGIFARRLASRGYDLLLVARRGDRLEALAGELASAHGTTAATIVADLAEDDGIHRVEERLRTETRLDLLVNNAGFGTTGRFFEADMAAQDRMLHLHVLAVARLTHAALAGMVERRRGGIINVSSVAAFTPSPGNVSYCSTKAWINSFTEGVYLELRAMGSPVRVQALCPGFTYSEFHDVMGMDRRQVPKSFWMSAEEVVDDALEGLDRGRLIVIPGWRYRLLAWLEQHTPRAVVRGATIRTARRWGKA